MDNEQIQRSRLFRENFLPGAVTRLRNQSNARVVGVRNNDVALDKVDKAQLTYTVKKFLSDWEGSGGAVEQGLRDAVDNNRLAIQSPSEVYVSPYPLLLKCSKCEVIDFYDNRLDAAKTSDQIRRRIISTSSGRTYIRCKRAGCVGKMHQIPYVGVHRCGLMNQLFIPYPARRNRSVGHASESGSFFSSYFFDVDTKERLGGSLQDDCPACQIAFPGSTEGAKRGTPVTSGESFYSQIIQYIALSPKTGALTALLFAEIEATAGTLKGKTGEIAEAITGILLGCFPSDVTERQLRTLIDEGAPSDDVTAKYQAELAKKIKMRDQLLPMKDDELMAEALAMAVDRIAVLEGLLAASTGRFKAVRELLDNDLTYIAIATQRRSIEAAFLRHDVKRQSIAASIAATTDTVIRESRRSIWQSVQNRYGIAEIAHIPDLMVVLSAVGFTRERRNPVIDDRMPPVVLNGFEDTQDTGLKGRTSMYAMSAQTEALWIRLDARKVLKWCIREAAWADPGDLITSSVERSHAHLLQYDPALTMAPGEVVRSDRAQQVGQDAPFHLLHSLCHTLLATSRRHTGYDDQSLMEYLLPMDLSFVLYVTSVQNFTAGGLLTLFQHYLLPWFDDASAYAFNCAFDPICSDTGGSCSGCIQRERACETFNAGLSRAYLHGGNVGPDQPVSFANGYWDAVAGSELE